MRRAVCCVLAPRSIVHGCSRRAESVPRDVLQDQQPHVVRQGRQRRGLRLPVRPQLGDQDGEHARALDFRDLLREPDDPFYNPSSRRGANSRISSHSPWGIRGRFRASNASSSESRGM